MSPDPALLVGQLIAAATFEEASAVALRATLDAAALAILSSRWPATRLLRALVHLRPQGGYRGLRVLEAGHQGSLEVGVLPFVPSASAWRWVETHRSPVAIDVGLGLVQPLSTPVAAPFVDETMTGQEGGAFSTEESRQRLLGRDCSHVVLFPLRTPGGGIDGAIAVEVACEAAMGEPWLWPGAEGALQLIADLSTPYLLNLPLRDEERVEDPQLPVVGLLMAPLVRTLRVFALQNETILFQGPTGVGKSRLARWCHERSQRADRPFVLVDLQTVPEDLQMGELFGWRRGAFTSAVTDNPGLVARAEGGTLFLDEIDKLSMRAQSGLLQLLEERRYSAMGEVGRDRKANVRFLIGTNVDLAAAVRAGRFREDLYYRINVLPVRVPSLRERADEVPAWAAFMLERRHREQGGVGRAIIAAEAALKLASLPWPGNLRQLDNVVRRACTHALVEQGDPSGDLVLRERHVDAALAAEAMGGDASLPGALRAAAAIFLDEAERRHASGQPWEAERAEVLRSFVVFAALQRYGDVDRAFRVLGHEALIKHRNHHKVLRRELARVGELYSELGLRPSADVAAILAKAEGG